MSTSDDIGDPPDNDEGPLRPMCCRCWSDEVEVLHTPCKEKPEALIGTPIGMYHCPDCGEMVLAGVPHPPMCAACIAQVFS